MDPLDVGAVGLVAIEWLALGWLSGVDWPAEQPVFWAPRWALRLLVGSVLVTVAQLVLAEIGLGIGSIAVVLGIAAVGAGGLRTLYRNGRCQKNSITAAARLPSERILLLFSSAFAKKPRSGGEAMSESTSIPMDTRERVGWLVLGGVLAVAVARSFLVPEAGWDAFSHWGLRAQAYALAGTIVDAHSEHEYYPPLVPLLEAWLYLHRGGVAIDGGKTVWALVGSAFAICLGWHLRLALRSSWFAPLFALAIVLATTAFADGFWTGQADLALTAYLTLSALAIVQWQRSPSKKWLTQAALFAAAAALA